AELAPLVAHLSPENMAAITQLWLTRLPQEIAARRQSDEAVAPQAVAGAAAAQDRQAARGRVVAGGWFRDDLTLSIRYRPVGHADPFVTAWIDLLVEAAQTEKHAALVTPLLKQQLSPTAPGLYVSCHSADRSTDGQLSVNWFAKRPTDRDNGFTEFTHGPHLTQAQLSDCQACHTIDATANVTANYQNTSPHDFADGFLPLTKQSCAECHTPGAAGDSCLECHRYHVGGR
ncbi:MAG: hypothetical protein ACR2NU_16160, partial [Aeoliella sp.]